MLILGPGRFACPRVWQSLRGVCNIERGKLCIVWVRRGAVGERMVCYVCWSSFKWLLVRDSAWMWNFSIVFKSGPFWYTVLPA
jgi:hypothetical protein